MSSGKLIFWETSFWETDLLGNFLLGNFLLGNILLGNFLLGNFLLGNFLLGNFLLGKYLWETSLHLPEQGAYMVAGGEHVSSLNNMLNTMLWKNPAGYSSLAGQL